MNSTAPVLLAGSLALNAGLAMLLVVGAANKPAALEEPAIVRASPRMPAAPVIDEQVWLELSEGDLPNVVARLRAAGFPPEIQRAIVAARLQEQFAARRKAIEPDADSRPFWKTTAFDPSVQRALRELSREQQKILRELLGDEAVQADPFTQARDQRQFGHLSPEKQAEARRIVREFTDLRSDLFMSFGGGPISLTSSMREKLNGLDSQMRSELAKLMSPEEFTNYELRGSTTANSLRYQLAAFDASEAEFRTLFQLQQSFDQRFPPMMAQRTPEDLKLRGEAQRQLTEQMKAALGSSRAEEYERATNYEYRTTSQLVARLELPAETTSQAWSVREEIQKQAQLLRQNSALSPEQRNAQLAALQQEAVQKVTPLFGGARGVEAYRQYGGQWIDMLVPRPPTPSDARR